MASTSEPEDTPLAVPSPGPGSEASTTNPPNDQDSDDFAMLPSQTIQFPGEARDVTLTQLFSIPDTSPERQEFHALLDEVERAERVTDEELANVWIR